MRSWSICIAALLLFCAIASQADEQYKIHLQSRRFVPDPLTSLRPERRAAGDKHYLLVQFYKLERATVLNLVNRGAKVLGSDAQKTLWMAFPGDFDFSTLGSSVRWLGKFAPTDKISNAVKEKLQKNPNANWKFIVEAAHVAGQKELYRLVKEIGGKFDIHPNFPHHVVLVSGTSAVFYQLVEHDCILWVLPAPDYILEKQPAYYCTGAKTDFGPVLNSFEAPAEPGWDGVGKNAANLTFHFVNGTGDVGGNNEQGPVEDGIREWSKHAQISYIEIGQAGQNDSFDISWQVGDHGDGSPFNGPGGVIAHAFFPNPPNSETIAGDIHFDDDENWATNFPDFLFNVAFHESGHSLGLNHTDVNGAIMFPSINIGAPAQQADPDDIAAIQTLYAESAPINGASDLEATAQSETQVNLAWTDNDDNEDGFRIERRVGAGSFSQIDTVGENTTSFVDLTAVEGTTFTYRVVAFNAGGDGIASNEAAALTFPAGPNNLSAETISANQIDLEWDDNSGGEDGFRIERELAGERVFVPIANVGANVTSFSDTTVVEEAVFNYRIVAFNATGDSDFSNVASASTGKTVTVNSNEDNGAGSLREAIQQAVNGDTVIFNLDKNKIALLSPITVNANIIIDGNNNGEGVILDGKNKTRLLVNDADVTVINFTFSKGRDRNGGDGGAILNQGTLELINCTVAKNSSLANGGGIHNINSATLTMTNCVIEKNKANLNGGAILNDGSLNMGNSVIAKNSSKGDGGAIFNSGTIDEIENSIFEKNKASFNGGAIFNSGSLSVEKSTFSKNSAKLDGGVVFNDTGDSTELENSTFSGNKAGRGGAIFDNNGEVDATNCTFFKNKSKDGGAIFSSGSSDVALADSLLLSSKAKVGPEISGNINSGGFNLVSDGTGASGFIGSDTIGLGGLKDRDIIDRKLQDNGGATLTHALLDNGINPAVDGGNPASDVDEDQRGFSRNDGNNDIGAFEAGALPLAAAEDFALEVAISKRGVSIQWRNSGNHRNIVGFYLWRKKLRDKEYQKVEEMMVMAVASGYYTCIDSEIWPEHDSYLYRLQCVTAAGHKFFSTTVLLQRQKMERSR